jgi:tetratricopeptide (TPR) repeat protein
MRRKTTSIAWSCIVVCVSISTARTSAQTPANKPATATSSPLERAVELAGKGRCEEALPLLKKLTVRATEKQLKYRALMAIVRCGMSQKEDQITVNALLDLKQDFPEDPQVLYMTSQIFLEIAERASQELASVAPESYQSRELQAETFESQEKWAEAIAVYRKILEDNPNLRGIHYRIGRALLSQPETPTSVEDAKKEFTQELAIDPVNAAAEFWLGELARREGNWDEAILHFGNAAKINPKFSDAILSLGTAFNSAAKYAEAIPQLEKYIKAVPDDPAGHYQLGIAYARMGRREDSIREMTLQRELAEKRQAANDARGNPAPH